MLNLVINKTISFSKSLYDDFKEFLAPSSCLCCGRIKDFDDPLLCPKCIEILNLKNHGGGPVCPFCGRPRDAAHPCGRCASPDCLYMYYWGIYDDELKDCLLQFKFHYSKELGERLVEMAFESLTTRIIENHYDYVVPVPLHRIRQQERRYNQSEIISEKLASYLGARHFPEMLIRIKPTKQQAKLIENDRWLNVKDAFAISDNFRDEIGNKSILLVDDIVTTGATIFEASRPIRELNPKRLDIFSLAMAK